MQKRPLNSHADNVSECEEVIVGTTEVHETRVWHAEFPKRRCEHYQVDSHDGEYTELGRGSEDGEDRSSMLDPGAVFTRF